MDLGFTADEVAFRDELRAFIRDHLPDDIRERMRLGYAPRKEDTVRWQRILNERGWAAFNWPKEYGGPGWTPVQRMIFLEENQLAPAPEVSSFNITMIGPVLIQFGTEEPQPWICASPPTSWHFATSSAKFSAPICPVTFASACGSAMRRPKKTRSHGSEF